MSDAMKGVFVGIAFGAIAGLGVCTWVIEGNWLFPGDTMLCGALICGILGYVFGDAFFTFARVLWDHLHWFLW